MPKQKQKGEKPQLTPNRDKSFSLLAFRTQALILLVIGSILYINTLSNEYALDDGIVIEKNEYVQQGFRGIPKIMSSDAYESFYKQMNAKQQLSGGRYRPLSVVTFAIEQQLFGSKKPDKPYTDLSSLRHFVNVALYVLSVIALLYLLYYFIFPGAPVLSFLCALIFLIHPMHTEVVANVKSRDEIMSLLFIAFTFIYMFRHRESGRTKDLVIALVFYFCALLSKEYAITLVALIPLLLFTLKDYSFKASVKAVLPYFIVAVLYMWIRLEVVGVGSTQENPDVLNNPFKYATPDQKWATKIEILNHYLRLLFFPYPLSADYSYNTIPYTNFSDPKVWLSIFVHISMVVAMVVLFIRRHVLSFALAFYLFHLFLVSNLAMDIGATMGERLVYHSSFGFSLLIGYLMYWIFRRTTEQNKMRITAGLTVVLVVACALVVIPRNADWKNDATLFIGDAETVPNSALVNGNAGKAFIDLSEKPENRANEMELLNKSIPYLKKSIEVHPQYVNGHLNLGVVYFKLGDYEKARECWQTAQEIYPNNPYLKVNFSLLGQVYFNEAMKAGAANIKEAIRLLEKAISVDPYNAELWYNLGGANFTKGDFEAARTAWAKTLQLKPDHTLAQQGMSALPKPSETIDNAIKKK
jgi:cytochrome c-type biogenesis protein CcmH/NrfG